MLEDISILIAHGPDNGQRDVVLKWILDFYKATMPDVEICIGELANNKDFCKARALNMAARKATKNIFVIADGDILYDPAILESSVKHLTKYPWILPVNKAMNLTKESTEKLLKENPKWPIPLEVSSIERRQVGAGLLNVVPRKHYETVGGFDERFIGWGGEDDAFSISMSILCGPPHRLGFTVHHLWHPSGDMSNYHNNVSLLSRYCQGREAIEELIRERKN
ncbi:MAG: hypothetical protein K0S71_1470 [Clostridia bacterium]|jgi:predicted glycosyltransferase involved in capsule biosynthesis|nr:hypothetical protein [Clostridia bacterium]